MTDSAVSSGTAILLAIVGVAVLAIVLSGNSNTTSVISSVGNAFTNAIKCALAPVTGGSCPSSSNSLIPIVTSTFST